MMDRTQTIKASATTLGLTHTKVCLEDILHTAEENDYSYLDFIGYILDGEILYRQDKAKDKRIKEAGFPYPKYLKDFDLNFCKAISRKQFKQLSELTWIDGLYNLILSDHLELVKHILLLDLDIKHVKKDTRSVTLQCSLLLKHLGLKKLIAMQE